MMALPIFQLGSNIWTGAWNMFSGIVTVLLCCFGEISMKKSQGLLLMSIVVTVVNIINLIVLEVSQMLLIVYHYKCANLNCLDKLALIFLYTEYKVT